MLEWLKRHAWKACDLPKGFASSNLALSARRLCRFLQSRLAYCSLSDGSVLDS